MADTNVIVPSVGESVTGGIVSSWLKQEGDIVEEEEEIFELETDKATLPIPSPTSGVLHIIVEEGNEVKIGDTVAVIAAKATQASTQKEEEKQTLEKKTSLSQEPEKQKTPSEKKDPILSPAARRYAEEKNIAPNTIPGTGKDARITKSDVLSMTQSSPKMPQRTPATAPKASETQTRTPMSTLRRHIAENLLRSKQSSAHLSTFNEVDMSNIIALRSHFKEEFLQTHDIRLGFMSFFLKAASYALQKFPAVNAYVDGFDIVYNHVYHIGVAISTDAGLIVPVLRDADQKTFADIEKEISDFAKRAKAKRILPDEFMGGTFTITNGGVFGSLLSTPIPNPPQTAILGMHSIQKRPIVIDDQIVIRPMMYLALTYDHRIIDGKQAIQFLSTIKQHIEEPERLLLDV